MAQTSAQCGLLPFSAEIRNKIYHHVFNSKKYLILWPVANPTDSTPPAPAADLALLRVSKATREEAMSVLYAECQFRYLMDFAVEVHSPLPPLQAVKLVNDITLEIWSSPGEETAQTCVALLHMLAETNVPCENFRIILNVQKLGVWRGNRRQTRVFFEALRGLRNFRSVIIEIIHVTRSQSVVSATKQMVRDRAKYYLGAPTEGEVKGRDILSACHLQFYPREHVIATMDKKAAKLEAKVASLRTQGDVNINTKVYWLEVRAANLRTRAGWKQGEQKLRLERSYWESASVP